MLRYIFGVAFLFLFFVFVRFMDSGKFVPDDIIFEVLVAAVDQAKGRGKHIMLDGFPRWDVFLQLYVCRTSWAYVFTAVRP